MRTRQCYFSVYFYGGVISSVFEDFKKIFGLAYWCFLNISVLSLIVFSLQFCAKYFEVKLRNQANLD